MQTTCHFDQQPIENTYETRMQMYRSLAREISAHVAKADGQLALTRSNHQGFNDHVDLRQLG
jgi:hypothetical protein